MAEGDSGREQGKRGADRNGGRLGEKSDLLLDAPQLKVDKLNLRIAKVLDLEIEGLETQLCLEADLENVVSLLNRLVSVIGDNPEVLQNLLDTVREAIATASEAVEEAADETGDEMGDASGSGPDRPRTESGDEFGRTVRHEVDRGGDIITTVLDEDGEVLDEQITGNLEELSGSGAGEDEV